MRFTLLEEIAEEEEVIVFRGSGWVEEVQIRFFQIHGSRFFEESVLEVHQNLPGHTAVLSDAEEAVLQLDFVLDVVEADSGATGQLPLLHRAEGGGGTLQSVFVAYFVQHGDVNVAHFLDHFHTTACIL